MELKNKKLLITGGTGSFGNSVLDSYIDSNLSEIIVFSRDEKKQEDMRCFRNNPKLRFILGDVRDYRSIRQATEGVDYVFHAAALKQVPATEFNAIEAVKTNILGTQNVIEAAVEARVLSLVVLSTDKAVYPINAMGISKAMAEKLVFSASMRQSKTNISLTRYGNVIASRGSVIPLFIEKIIKREPIAITDPNMTRFIMSLEESVDLVKHAFNNTDGGALFVQKSPSAKVETIVKALELILKLTADQTVIGTRHGEKKHETLVTREELYRTEDKGEYFKIHSDNRRQNYNTHINKDQKNLTEMRDYNSGGQKVLNEVDLAAI